MYLNNGGDSDVPVATRRPSIEHLLAFKPSPQVQRLMARRNTWSSRHPTIREEADEAAEYLSKDDIRKSIVLSMAADDEDWSNYRRRSSGGTAQAIFHQSRSRRSSRDDSCTNETDSSGETHRSADTNGNYEAGPSQNDESDTSCEDLLRFVKEKLDKFEMENSSGAGQLAEERRRRYGLVARQPNVNRLVFDKEKYRHTRPTNLSRYLSEPGPSNNDTSPSVDPEPRSHSALESHHHIKQLSNSSDASSGVFDISGQTSENRFPWLKDQATQCQIISDETKAATPGQVIGPVLNHISATSSASLAQRSYPSPRTSRSQSQSAIFGQNDRMRMPRKHDSTSSLPVIHDGKVILEPAVLQHSLEFYAEQATEKQDLMDDPITNYRSGRRSCVISALDFGDSAAHIEESSETQPYPGDLALHNGQALRNPSPTGTMVNGSADHYGSEGSLVDSTSTNSSALSSNDKKPLKAKTSTSFLNKLGGWKEKKKIPDLEYLLMNMGITEFKDEKLASFRHVLWQVLLCDAEVELDDITDAERTRRNAIWEIFTNECTFLVDHLMVLKHCFLEPLKKCQVEGLLMDVQPEKLFGNLDELCDLSYRFCLDFIKALRKSAHDDFASTDCMCNCLDDMTKNSRDGDIYHSYLLNYRSSLTYLDIIRNTIEDYAVYERICEQDARCNRLRLTDFLIAPMQHWTRLPLLLKNIRKYTLTHSDKAKLDASIEKVVSSTKSLENKIDWLKTFERVKEIEKQLVWPTISEIDSKAFIPETLKGLLTVQPTDNLLDNRTREITFEGPLILTERDSRTIDAHVFLFTDFLLFTKIKKDTKKTRGRMSTVDKNEGYYQVLRQPIQIESLSVHDIGQAEASASNMKNLFVVVQRNSFQQVIGVFTLQAHTSLGKEKWLTHLRDNKEKSTEINNNKTELASRQKSFRDNHENSLLNHNLLKHSQVLEISNATLPRSRSSTASSVGSSRPKSFNQSEDDSGNISPIATHKIYDKSRTMSTGCLNSEHSNPQLTFMSNSDYVH